MRRFKTFLLMGALTVTALVACASFAGAKTLPADAAASPSPSPEPATQVSGTVLGVGGKGSSTWQEPIAGAQIFMTDTSAATPKNVKVATTDAAGRFSCLVDLWKMKNKKANFSVTLEHYYIASAWITQNATTPQVITLKANVWPTIIVGNVTNKLMGGKAPKHPHIQLLNFDTHGKTDHSYKIVCTLQPNEDYKVWCSASGFVRMHKWGRSKPVQNAANARHLNFRMAPK